jgi:putative membrane protein
MRVARKGPTVERRAIATPNNPKGACIMNGARTFLSAFVLCIPLFVTAAVDDERKLIDKSPPDREPTTEKEFLIRAIAFEVAEVKFAEKAAKNAQSEDVRKLAQAMVDEHTKVRDALLEQAKKQKLAVVEGLEKSHRDEYARLSKLSGAEFDREFLRWVIDSHERAAKLYKKWAKSATDEDLRATADRALERAQDHLSRAKKLSPRTKE